MLSTIKPILKGVNRFIKRRILNTKGNRVYVQDSELAKLTSFKPGVYLQCILDTKTNTLRIIPSEEGTMKVARRKRKDHIGSVIDIRKKDILAMFNDYDLLDLVIYEDEIIVTGLSEVNNVEVTDENVVLFNDIKLKKRESISVKSSQIERLHNEILLKCSGDNITHDVTYRNLETKTSETVSYEASDLQKMFSIIKSPVDEVVSLAVRVVSICAGCGVLDKGFYDEGYHLKFALELEKDMAETYAANLGNHVVVGDLSKYPIEDIPDAEVCIAGVPCVNYTNANRVTGDDVYAPENLLIRNVMDIIENMKSLKVFVIENVDQILTKGRVYIKELYERFSDFDITINKVDSSKYGSAQKRKRTIIIGSKIGPIHLPDSIIAPVRTVRDALRGITDDTPNQLDRTTHKAATLEIIKSIPKGGNIKDAPKHLTDCLKLDSSHSNRYYRLQWDSFCKSLANVRKTLFLHPEEDRAISVRETARLFDLFPDENGKEFIFKGSITSKRQMISNAVPLSIATVIAKEIKKTFKSVYGDKYNFNFGKNAQLVY